MSRALDVGLGDLGQHAKTWGNALRTTPFTSPVLGLPGTLVGAMIVPEGVWDMPASKSEDLRPRAVELARSGQLPVAGCRRL